MKDEPEFLGQSQEEAFRAIAARGWRIRESEGFIALVGPVWLREDGEHTELGFLAEDRHHNRRGVLQGGMTATLADIALGLTARNNDPERRQATIDLGVQYIDAVRIGDFAVARCEIVRRTRSLVFVRGLIVVSERPVAAISGIFKALA